MSTLTDVATGATYTFRMGDGPALGPYSIGYAMGMSLVMMELGEPNVEIIRTVTYRRPDGTTYEGTTHV